jgi:hypothetical protein
VDPPHITCSPASITRHIARTQLSPSHDQLSVSNAGLSYTVASDTNWLSVTPATGATANGLPNTHDLVYDVSGLAIGTYTAKISVTSPDADNSPQTVGVSLIIDPNIVCAPASFARHVMETQPLPDDSFTVSNPGSTALSYTISSDASWLSASPAAGSANGGAAVTHRITYGVADLPLGTYNGSITITSPDNPPQTIGVTVTVDPLVIPGDMDGDWDVDQSDFGLFQACLSGSGNPQTDPACARARLDGDSDVDGDDLALFLRCFSGAGIRGNPNCKTGSPH